jgi:pentatricopeptide repeat protein
VLQPNFQIYTTIINALCKEGLVDEAFEAFRKMEEDGYSPDEWSYNVIIRGFLQHKDASRAVQLIGEMRDRGFFADAHTKALMVDLLSNDENL